MRPQAKTRRIGNIYISNVSEQYFVGDQGPRKNLGSHIDASHSRQPLVKGERLVRYEVNAVMLHVATHPNPTYGLQQTWWAMGTGVPAQQCQHASIHVALLGRGPHKNCKNDLDDQT
jgi:hypothetical protein